jgi:hypothetical protein
MNLPMVDTIKEIRQLQSQFSTAKRYFDLFAQAPVFISDGNKKSAIEEAQKLMKLAAEHHVTVEHAVEELLHPETAQGEIDRLLKQAKDHSSELGKFLDEVGKLLGAELEVLHDVLAEGAAQKVK